MDADPECEPDDAPDDFEENLLGRPAGQPERKDVYVLGAGFSKALHPAMPSLGELSQAVSGFGTSYGTHLGTSGLDSSIGKLIQRNFEEALSYLAEQKPWLEESENQKDRVRLLELTRNIRVAIGHRQTLAREAIEAGKCDWIVPMVEHWHRSRAVVITLNYDTLVEEIVERIGTADYPGIPHPTQPNSVTADERTNLRVCNIHSPILKDAWLNSSGAGFSQYFHHQPSFRLLKLHGSVNWFKSPNSGAQSDTISYIPAKDVSTYPDQAPPAWIADKAPFIVPPVPNKGSLVYHDSLRAIWREAAQAVKWANRIVVIGYSMPANDTLLMQLIRGSLFNTTPRIDLVNPDQTLKEKVKELFSGENSVIEQDFHGPQCVRDFVTQSAYRPN